MQGSKQPPESGKPAKPGSSQAITSHAPAAGGGYGIDPTLPLVEIPLAERIDANNIRAYAHAYFAGKFERIGGYRAVDTLVKRYIPGDVHIGTGDLQTNLCKHIENERLRLPHDDRNRILRRVSDDTTLERHMARLGDACIALDLSCRPGFTVVPEPTAQFMVRAAIEELQLHLDNEGAGGVGLVADEATDQMIACIEILEDEHISEAVPGYDMFDRIAWLTAHETDRPTVQEARQIVRVGSVGRLLFLKLADEVGQLGTTPASAIGELAQEWRFASGCMPEDIDEESRAGHSAAREEGRTVIYFRGRGST